MSRGRNVRGFEDNLLPAALLRILALNTIDSRRSQMNVVPGRRVDENL